MTARERANHMIINGARRSRIAKGSGTSVQDVNNLLKQYAQTRKMMKSITGGADSWANGWASSNCRVSVSDLALDNERSW